MTAVITLSGPTRLYVEIRKWAAKFIFFTENKYSKQFASGLHKVGLLDSSIVDLRDQVCFSFLCCIRIFPHPNFRARIGILSFFQKLENAMNDSLIPWCLKNAMKMPRVDLFCIHVCTPQIRSGPICCLGIFSLVSFYSTHELICKILFFSKQQLLRQLDEWKCSSTKLLILLRKEMFIYNNYDYLIKIVLQVSKH